MAYRKKKIAFKRYKNWTEKADDVQRWPMTSVLQKSWKAIAQKLQERLAPCEQNIKK